MSEHGRRLLMEWEGFKAHVYRDSAGLDTIGVGHLLTVNERLTGVIMIKGKPVTYRNGLTTEQVSDLLAQDLEPKERAVSEGLTVELEQHQFDALVSFCFNVGAGAFEDSTLLRCVNAQRFDEVPAQFRRWNRAGGRVVTGLTNRRDNEINLWLSPMEASNEGIRRT
jgi:lysozyme